MDSNEFGFGEEESTAQTAANELIQELENPVETVSDEQYMEDVDRRLDVASTYRQLLRAPLFESPNESTKIVETEIREFVVQRLKVLLNMAPAPQPVVQAQLPFDEQELKTLKILLSSLAERAAKKAEPTSGPPQVAKTTLAPAPQPPTVRRATAPASAPVAAPKQPARPVGRPPGPAKSAPVAPKPPEENLVELEDPRSGQTILARKPRRQVRSRGAIPMPRGGEMEQILHMQAQGSGAAMGVSSPVEGTSVPNSLGAQLVQNSLNSEE
jgi:hypothetical protein